MISREEAIKKLKEFWGVEEFTFLAKFELAKNKGDTLKESSFGFFNELQLNKKQLFLPPVADDNGILKPATCFALKGNLEDGVFYMVTAELSPDEKRNKNSFALSITNAIKASEKDILNHKAHINTKKDKLLLAYVNFAAPDNSHAYINIVEDLSAEGIRSIKSIKGQLLNNPLVPLKTSQLVVVKKKNKETIIVSDTIVGHYLKGQLFINTHTFDNILLVETKKNLDENGTFETNSSIPEDNVLITEKCLVKIYNQHKGFEIEEIETNKVIDIPDLTEEIDTKLEKIFCSEIISLVDKKVIKYFIKINPNIKNKILDRFNQDSIDSDNLEIFLNKWSAIFPESISYKSLALKLEDISKYHNLLMKFWINKKISNDFFEEYFFDCFITYLENFIKDLYQLFITLNKIQVEKIKTCFLNYFETKFVITSISHYELMLTLTDKFLLTNSEKKHKRAIIKESINDDVKYILWKNGNESDIPLVKAISNFKELNTKQQEQVILLIDDKTLDAIVNFVLPTENIEINERVNNVKHNKLLHFFNPVCFDIESNKENIYEIAWNEGDSWFNHLKDKVDKGVELFKIVFEGDNIIVGHNVLEFDLPLLNSLKGISCDTNKVWDTLKIEMILSPEFKTFALNTDHSALKDAQLTYELFQNQLYRLLMSESESLEPFKSVLSENIINKLITVKNEFNILKDISVLNKEKLKFYRPQPKINSVLIRLDQMLNDSSAEKKIIIGTSSMLPDILSYGKVTFTDEVLKQKEYQTIDSTKVGNNENLSAEQKGQIISYLIACQNSSIIPYWGNISPAIKISIEENMDVWELFAKQNENHQLHYTPLFITVGQLEEYYTNNKSSNEYDLFILQSDLISISQKEIVKKFDIEQLKSIFQENFFWLKFSGGQSIVSIEKNDLKLLGIYNDLKFDNYWIEKYQYGRYVLYANKNWESVIDKIPHKNKFSIELDPEQFKSDQVNCIKFYPNKNRTYNITRFNPESIYRSRYWVIQKKILDQLVLKGVCILLVQREEEIEAIVNYLIDQGYYIPKSNISIGRRLELLHRSEQIKKIIIEHINNADSILKFNHSNSINLIIDSFKLVEPFYCSQDSTFFKNNQEAGTYKKSIKNNYNSNDENQEELDIVSSNTKDVFLKDTYFLLKLLRPKITHLRNLLYINNPSNRLWLLDPRIEDHYDELSKQWNFTRHQIDGWETKKEYEDDVVASDNFINSPKPTEIPFTIGQSMELIRKAFIPEHQWKPEQIPYLENILASKNDWLITLPTGVGKSILFQGPAILKSAFTNRLTLVITPLKALMEDHVNNLWDKGFYGNVDYLNSDRSSDTQLIYRGIAGGELSLLFITPERFRSRGFLNALESRIQSDGGLEYFVFDEAHCVSQWGQEFRPDYFNCAKLIWRTKISSEYKTPLLLFSATVSEKIYQDFNSIFS